MNDREIMSMSGKLRWPFISVDNSGSMTVDGASVKTLVEEFGSPLYVLSEKEIRNRMKRIKKAFPYKKLEIQYAAKCNTNLEILRIAKEEGLELDASSTGEIMLGLLAGFEPGKITFTNLHKKEEDWLFAAKIGVKAITIDAVEGIPQAEAAGKQLDKKLKIFLRINPQIKRGRYSTIHHQYGIPIKQAKFAIDKVLEQPHLELVGFHFHGSYIDNKNIHWIAAKKLLRLAKYAHDKGARIKYIDCGGGFPVQHTDKKVFQPEDMGEEFVRQFREKVAALGLPEPTLIFEPGKFIVANAGVGLVKVVSVKDLGHIKAAITDGSTYAFVPDVLAYGWHYPILPATKIHMPPEAKYHIAGCTCDDIDKIGRERKMPYLERGDILSIMDCGAYSNVMTSNFNTLKRAPMVMVKDGVARLIRRRDKYGEMFAQELDVLKLESRGELNKFTSFARQKLKVPIDELQLPEEAKPK